MVQRLIVPVDGSSASWTAFDVAVSLARRCNVPVDVVQVEFDAEDRPAVLKRLNDELGSRAVDGVEVTAAVEVTELSVAGQLELIVLRHPGSTVVMSSRGRGRTVALVGSVAQDVLDRTFGPIMLVGPHATTSDFSGPVVVSVDGSAASEAAVPLAVGWAIQLDVHPWIVYSAAPDRASDDNVAGSGYLSRLAQQEQDRTGRQVDFDQLHEPNAAAAVPDYATRSGASLIVASSHGRSGWSRLTMGSVTSGYVRHATCPVLVLRLPRPVEEVAGGSQPAWAV